MRKLIVLAAATAMALGGTAVQAETAQEKGEAKLAKMLEGRVAGEPVKCINTMGRDHLKIIDRTAIVYDAGRTIYVAKPSRPGNLDDSDILLIERYNGSQLCTSDMIKTLDRSGGFMTGIIFLEDFVPYTKPEED